MLPSYGEILARQRRHEDLLKEAERERLYRLARPRRSGQVHLLRKAARWVSDWAARGYRSLMGARRSVDYRVRDEDCTSQPTCTMQPEAMCY